MSKKTVGKGSLSLLLSIAAFLWMYTIQGRCLGDEILTAINLPAWSNGTSGIHYTVFYAFIFLLPAFLLGVKYNHHKLAAAGKWISAVFMILLLAGMLFMIA